MNGKKGKRKERRRKVNKEEMNNRIQENVQPKYNREKNLNEIKENLTFTDEKEIMENMITEKQNQTKKIRWIALFSIIFACIILIGSNCITYFTTSNNKEVILLDERQKLIVAEYLKENDYKNYFVYPELTVFVQDKYEFSIYEGKKDNEKKYVYYIENLVEAYNSNFIVNIFADNNKKMDIVKEKEDQYTIGELIIEDLNEGSQLNIEFYEDEQFMDQRIVTL